MKTNFLGKHHSLITKQKISERKKLWWQKLKNNPQKEKEFINKLARRGELHGRWKGGRYVDSKGYVFLYQSNHPSIKPGGSIHHIGEHRLVMEKYLGRYLKEKEGVHHKNGIKGDNRIENLVLFTKNNNWHNNCCPKCGFEFLIK